jgi:DNA repair exonuclease SbcCD ATPase subunit/DNA repair exonuclease SbcCD nuclease subunit
LSYKIAHISDTHIKNLKYHYEYRVVFEQLYEKLREEEVDYIVHTGDLAHTKTQLSPEFFEMASDFLRNLADIAPTYCLLGNHDGNLKNSSRQDALTPIVMALEHPNLHLLKDAGETNINDEVCLNVLSVFDRENWIKPTNTDKINIALYHGSISNCKTDVGWVMLNGEDTMEIFDGFDFAMLGDIHRRQILDDAGRIWYAGSTVQQNHGETNDKGILIWDIQSKDEWDVEPVVFKNPKPFITLELTPKGRMPKGAKVTKGARLRLVSNNNLPLNVMKRAMDIAKHRFKPEVVTFLNRAAGERGDVSEITDTLKTENLRDINIQEELIDEYLKDYQVDSSTLERVYDLNRKYKKQVEDSEEVSRNVNWKLTNFEFDNLFNYGEGNNVSFENLNGIIGIFGKNYSGKSSIIDGVLWTLFNTTSKNERKNLNVINQNKESCRGKVTIDVGHKTYTIERTATKYIKRLKGEETEEAKTDLNFEVYNQVTDETLSLNGLSRPLTDANIRKHFGTIDDFLVSSMASQHGALAFIDEGSTRRKEIIAKFLDLEVFERKFKLAKDDSTDLKGALRRLEARNYDEEIGDASAQLEDKRQELEDHKIDCEELQEEIEQITKTCEELRNSIDAIPEDVINVVDTKREIRNRENQVASLESDNKQHNVDLSVKRGLAEKIEEYLSKINVDALTEQIETINTAREQKEAQANMLADLTQQIEDIERKSHLLDGIPCGTDFPQCKFIRDANVAVANLPHVESEKEEARTSVDELEEKLKSLKPDFVEDQLDKYNKIIDKRTAITNDIADLNLSIERNQASIDRLGYELKDLEIKKKQYEENKEVIENFEEYTTELDACAAKLEKAEAQYAVCQTETLELYKSVGSLEQKVESIETQKQEYIDLQEEYSAYDLYMRCMHSSGISYDVVKRKLPIINQEIAKVLANIVEFEIFFEDSGKKFDIFIKHPRHDPRPIEMASGAEKSLAAIAIRLALLGVSSLPKSSIFCLDEPGTALDQDNMEGFVRILEIIKVYFPAVLLISHLDSLKDCVDTQIEIDKAKGYARVNQ